MYVGIDDTDSAKGMCTTYLALEVIKEFTGELDLVGFPRLVRLNPNIPWKTRGNAAISLHLKDKPKKGPGAREVLERVTSIVDRLGHVKAVGTNSAIVVTMRRPAPSFYRRTVREVVKIREAREALPKGSLYKTYGNGRGLVGATAAIAWVPRDRTYEILVYRERGRWGTKRKVAIKDVKRLDAKFPSTYNNYDPENRHAAIIPKTPCPILFGIRGEDPKVLPKAMDTIASEKKASWLVFQTNQGTDDHMIGRRKLAKYTSGILRARVTIGPWDIRGGHVLFKVEAHRSSDQYTCAAYEPTKQFRTVVRKLVPGDELTIMGSRGASNPNTVNIEKIKVEGLVPVAKKVGNPICPTCGKSMKSVGRGAGYRCRACGTKASDEDCRSEPLDRGLSLGWYEVPICAMRHLHKPLSRKS